MGNSRIDLVIKFGGSAITDKQTLETLNLPALQTAAVLVKECINRGLTCVIVHGAGSFGHHHAKNDKVNQGWSGLDSAEDVARVKKGFCLTRQSVTKLHQHVIDTLLAQDIPATGLTFYSSWTKSDGELVESDLVAMDRLLGAGLLPIMHGDCILDTVRGCGILSGDTIIKTICSQYAVSRVVFLTSVQGVYSQRPEDNPGAKLHSVLCVEDGSLVPCRDSKADHVTGHVTSDCVEHDVTGGMTLKLQTAAEIVTASEGRTRVYVCKLGTEYAKSACVNGDVEQCANQGTLISLSPDS